MRLVSSLPAVLALLAAAASPSHAQRRAAADPVGGTDIQVIADGLDVTGAGLRFWTGPRDAVAIRATAGFRSDADPALPDVTRLSVGGEVEYQRHAGGAGRVHPFVGVAVTVRYDDVDGSGTAAGDDARTTLGGGVSLGAEARLVSALTLSAQVGVAARYAMSASSSERRTLDVGLGGVPRLALSLRF